MHLQYGGIYNSHINANRPEIVPVREF